MKNWIIRFIKLLKSPYTLIKRYRTAPIKWHEAVFSTEELYSIWESVCTICKTLHTDKNKHLCRTCKKSIGLIKWL